MKKKVILAVVWVFLIGSSFSFLAPPNGHAEPQVRLEAADQNSDGMGFEEIERKVKELIYELEKLQKGASQKLRKEVIPFLEKEIDRLQEWLRDFRLNQKKAPETRKT